MVYETFVIVDKKNAHNQICFTMLEQIGQFKINVHAEDALILEALDYYDAVLSQFLS